MTDRVAHQVRDDLLDPIVVPVDQRRHGVEGDADILRMRQHDGRVRHRRRDIREIDG
jgi:hypothetical protein